MTPHASPDTPTPPPGMNRRHFLQTSGLALLGVAGLGSALSACSSDEPDGTAGSGQPTSDELVYAGFGGSYEEAIMAAVFDPFAEEFDLEVTATTGSGDIARIEQMVTSGRTEWDLVDSQGATLGQMLELDLLQELEPGLGDDIDLAQPDLVTPYSIPWYQFSHNIFWNTDTIEGPLTSWADVWDVERFPGQRGLQRVPWFTLEIALVADGVPLDELYPLDLDRAFASLDRIRPHAVFLDNNALTNAVTAQDVVVADINLLRVKSIIEAGVPLEYTWEQAMIDVQQLVVLEGAPNPDNAMRAIEFAMRPEAQRQVLDTLGYAPTVSSVIDEIDDETASDLPGTPQTVDNSFYLSSQWWADNGQEASERFESWLAS